MPSQKHTKALIAGGSVAELTLANVLEQLGIDYLVLEKYCKNRSLGASIGIFPSGFRILDQLGCYGAIKALVEGADAFETLAMRNEHGQIISGVTGAFMHFNKRHVDLSRARGDIFYGDILVGANGIHSTIRREMWSLADQDSPGYFLMSNPSDVPTEYCCISGISHPSDRFSKYSSQNIGGRNYSYPIATGPNHRIYWFLFKKLPDTTRGLYEKIPRSAEEQRDALATEQAEDRITDTLASGKLYAMGTTATLQVIPEAVFKKWHYNRIMTIGNAAHKFNPIGGQSGNSSPRRPA
ncbi:FAD/NAD(P)-binding domain-containing protein [Macroventuria anomochaeta]|uniref:FAD/NAD(P)-binding domain-containing protein n=1 Tax=Macroventuria anomochaeta TaxID=301207 RepID=A0ACB6RXQ2_9PLEO|nr:FAD/NAD(P)-binding domain-containing protein [Macroventuria anomochaeta]KAF2626656.1 FAD/NAD(P)-binding domain-containing protein [Macroventuria anomochaeta]